MQSQTVLEPLGYEEADITMTPNGVIFFLERNQ